MNQSEIQDIAFNVDLHHSGYPLAYDRRKLNNLSKAKVLRACRAALKGQP